MATKPTYNVNNTPGLARTVHSRTSGTQLNIWYSPEAKSTPRIKANEDKPWTVECEDHKAQRSFVTRTEARQHREDPASFCPKCKAAAKKAPAVKATPIKADTKKAVTKKAAPAKRASAKKAA